VQDQRRRDPYVLGKTKNKTKNKTKTVRLAPRAKFKKQTSYFLHYRRQVTGWREKGRGD